MQISIGKRLLMSLFAVLAVLVGGCRDDLESVRTPLYLADAGSASPTDEACPIHPTEDGDDACCGCHYFAIPDQCLPMSECEAPSPTPYPTAEGDLDVYYPTPAESPTESPTPYPTPLGVIAHANTYYRIGGGAEPKADEVEYLPGESGENGKIKKGGGDKKVGVSFYSTPEDAMKARDRIKGETGKIHKVSFYNEKDLTFIGSQPPANHFHLVPAREMTFAEYKEALKKVKLTKYEP